MALLRILLLAIVLLAGTTQFIGCERNGSAEKAGEKIDEAAEEAGEEAEEAGEKATE